MPRSVLARVALVALVLAAAVGVYVFLTPAPATVDIARVDRGPLEAVIDGEGKTRVSDRFVVSSDVSGIVARIALHEGDAVRRGALVAEIDATPYTVAISQDEARLREIEAQLSGVETLRPKPQTVASAEAALSAALARVSAATAHAAQAMIAYDQALREHDRAHALFASGAISKAALEAADTDAAARLAAVQSSTAERQAATAQATATRLNLDEVRAKRSDPDYMERVYAAQAESVKAEIRRLHTDIARTKVYAPADGRVLRIIQQSAQFVQAGAPLIEIGDPKALEFVVDLLTSDAAMLRPPMPVVIDDGSGQWRFKGVVRRVEPAAFTKVSALGVEEQRVNVIGGFTTPHDTLGDAFRIEARIVTWRGPDVVRVPIKALFRCADAWCAFAVKDGRAHEHRVGVGHFGIELVEVTSGLAPGDLVVVHPSDAVGDGKTVELAR